jgi:hypothetical protein
MNRRNAIFRLLILGGGAAGVYGGIRGYNLLKEPELEKLKNFQPLIDELAEVIIPRTSTPGAKDVGAGVFVSHMIREATPHKSQNNFLDGLEKLSVFAAYKYGNSFDKCSHEQKISIVNHFEKAGRPYGGILGKAERYLVGDSFFILLKKYTLIGYCTSMKGATETLSYDFIPGKHVACIKMNPGQRAWATH